MVKFHIHFPLQAQVWAPNVQVVCPVPFAKAIVTATLTALEPSGAGSEAVAEPQMTAKAIWVHQVMTIVTIPFAIRNWHQHKALPE